MRNAFSKNKVGGKKPTKATKEPIIEAEEAIITRREDEPHAANVAKGCFVRNITHKDSKAKRVEFKIGEKLDPKHEDFKLLEKHLA